MKKGKYLLILAAFAVIGLASVKPAMAYFTDYALATGYHVVKVHDPVVDPPTENVKDMVKTISLTNTGDFDMYVRVRAICPDTVTATMENTTGWTKDGDFYTYDAILPVGQSTSEINLRISEPTGELAGSDFNVVIIQEGTKVHYKEDGTPYANWQDKITERREF